MSKPAWMRFEEVVNVKLGLDATAASGATWKDKGDGSTRNNYEEPWPLLADAKTTEKASYSLKAKFLDDMRKVALQDGKTFALPVKFLGHPAPHNEWVVVPLDDYAYLVEEHRKTPPAFTVEDIALVRALQKSVKTPLVQDMIGNILEKMGVES